MDSPNFKTKIGKTRLIILNQAGEECSTILFDGNFHESG